jgi:hypothetical protein
MTLPCKLQTRELVLSVQAEGFRVSLIRHHTGERAKAHRLLAGIRQFRMP